MPGRDRGGETPGEGVRDVREGSALTDERGLFNLRSAGAATIVGHLPAAVAREAVCAWPWLA